MSAYVVDRETVDQLVRVFDVLGVAGDADCDAVGQALVDECVRSVSYRYPDCDAQAGELPGPCDAYYLRPYAWTYCDMPGAAEALKLIGEYDYQSCEHPGWLESDVHRWCADARSILERAAVAA